MMLTAAFTFYPAVSHGHGFMDLVIDAVVRGVIYQVVRAVFHGHSLPAVLGIGFGVLLIAWALYSLRRR